MGVINVTLDSFFQQSRVSGVEDAISRGIQMYKDGADWLDIGGESTHPLKPYPTSEKEELAAVIPVIQALSREVPIPISVDTIKPRVAAAALEAGASLINDVSGFRDPEMRALAASSGVKICVMHMPAAPYALQSPPCYPNGVTPAILQFFEEQLDLLFAAGVSKQQVILDPGVGGGQFGKTVDDNIDILQNLPQFRALGYPILLGVSRKTFIRNILKIGVEECLPATLTLNVLAVQRGIHLLRVHDVKEHREMIDLLGVINREQVPPLG